MRPAVLILAFVVASPALGAQSPDAGRTSSSVPAAGGVPRLVPGSRVRVTVSFPPGHALARQQSLSGSLLRLDAASIVVQDGIRTVAIPRDGVTGLAIHTGGRSRGQALRRGAMIGLVAGGAVGGVSAFASYEPCTSGEFFCFTRRGETMMGMIAGGVVGTVVGGLAGAMVGGREWRSVPLTPESRVGLIASPTRVGMRLQF
jgi:hypothetical protein